MTIHEAQPADAQAVRTLLAGERPVLLCFVADWAPPCRELAPTLGLLADTYYGTVEIVTVDPDLEPLLANELRIVSLPTMLLYVGGAERERMVGLRSYDDIEKKLNKYLSPTSTAKEGSAR